MNDCHQILTGGDRFLSCLSCLKNISIDSITSEIDLIVRNTEDEENQQGGVIYD